MATDLKYIGYIPAAWPIILISDPSFARGRVIAYFIAWSNRRASPRAAAGVFS
jgi:hypothetical protein